MCVCVSGVVWAVCAMDALRPRDVCTIVNAFGEGGDQDVCGMQMDDCLMNAVGFWLIE